MQRKVIQWATGGIGKAAIQGIVDHPDLELVGCWVNNPDKVGKDAGDIAGTRKTGVLATNDVEAILKLDADCVVYGPAFPVEDDIVRLLESGKSVVTPTGWFYPAGSLDVTRLEAACKKGNSVLHGTGIHPGGFSEKFPLMLAGMQRATTYVRCEEFSDIRTYGAPEIVGEMMGFGKTPEEVAARGIAQYLAVGFYQSIRMVADALQLDVDAFETKCEFGLATAPIDSPIGPIPVGKVAAMKLTWQGLHKGSVVVEEIVNWFMGEENFDKPWKFGPEGTRYEVEVKGDPDLKSVYHGTHPKSLEEGLERNAGIVVTAMHCVNSIPYICTAQPGIRTYLDLPLVAGRAAPELLKKR
jgi:hypothetical protein